MCSSTRSPHPLTPRQRQRCPLPQLPLRHPRPTLHATIHSPMPSTQPVCVEGNNRLPLLPPSPGVGERDGTGEGNFEGRLLRPILRLHLDHELLPCPLPSREVELPCERGLGPQHGEGGDGGEVGGVGRGPRPHHGVCDDHEGWGRGYGGGCGNGRRGVCGGGCGGGAGRTRGHVEGHLVARLCRSNSVPGRAESLVGVHGRTGIGQPAVPLLLRMTTLFKVISMNFRQ